MPANKKYLLKTRLGRTSKILASIFGGLTASLGILTALALLTDPDYVLLSIWFVFPLLWASIIVVVYWIKKPWKAWVLLLSVILSCVVAIYFLKTSP